MSKSNRRSECSAVRSIAAAVVIAGLSVWGQFTVVSTVQADDADKTVNTSASDDAATNDPLETLNRFTSGLNRALRKTVLDPLVDGYQYVTPDPVEQSISNVVSNLTEPVTAVSSLLQGDIDNAETATGRFLINSTLGLGGTSDPATDMGMEQRREDLGQAFGAHGMEPGPHIVLPILGPSNLRDVTGDILTGLASPLPLAAQAAGGTVEYSDNQDDLNALEGGAVDPYVTEREAYNQHRAFVVNNGETESTDFPTFADPASDPGVANSQ